MQNPVPPIDLPASPAPEGRWPAWVSAWRILAVSALIWAGFGLMGALSGYVDMAGAPGGKSFKQLLFPLWLTSIPLVLFSAGLYVLFQRHPTLVQRPRRLIQGYGLLLLGYFPLQAVYMGLFILWKRGAAWEPAAVLAAAAELSMTQWFVDFVVLSGMYAAILALASWRLSQAQARAAQEALAANLRLNLALEQQRLVAIKRQLEPHFLFNALNAISALVRGEDKKMALSGITRLSDLLRYALTAGERQSVSLGEELRFVEDYLALQRLRYGERLCFALELAEPALLRAECPPLLLQPLVENALRHDLDVQEGNSDIRLCIAAEGEGLLIRLSNPLHAEQAPPGFGLGLRHSRERLALGYGAAAWLRAGEDGGRFLVELYLPREPAEASP